MSYLLLIFSFILVIISYLFLTISWFINRKRKFDDYTGFDASKDVIVNDDSINIVNSSSIVFSEYDIKRNVVRLNNKNYEGNSYFDIGISAILSGYSLVNDDNKKYFKFSFIFNKIKCISFCSLFMLVLSCFINNIGDARIGIIFFCLLLIYQYMRYLIIVSSNDVIKNNLREDVLSKVESFVNSNIKFCKLNFLSGLVMLLRLVTLILEM